MRSKTSYHSANVNYRNHQKSKIETPMTNFGKKKTNFDSKASLKMYEEIASKSLVTKKPIKSNRNNENVVIRKNGTVAAESITSLQKEARSTNQASSQTN